MFATKHLFPGGVHPREGKNGKAVNGLNAITALPAPARAVIPLSQHIGAPAKAVVKKGDHVRIGQVIGEAGGFMSAPVHASVSGTVAEVGSAILANGTSVPAVIIENDGLEEWVELHPAENLDSLTPADMQRIIREAGIVGMGGATFPTSVKLTPGAGKTIEKLLINGAECEPYLTADHRLMVEHAEELTKGVKLLMKAFSLNDAAICVEQNKPDAIEALRKAAAGIEGLRVVDLPVRYPQGGEKQLIYAVTQRVVPAGGLPIDVGCVVCNVGTTYAIQQAVCLGKPLIERVTTVGGLVNRPGNYLVRIGTQVRDVLRAAGGVQKDAVKLINGGPMMGIAFNNYDVPVTKGTSGLLALGREAAEPQESACIRCGRCVLACPMQLVPMKMDMLVRRELYDELDRIGVLNCIECGACTFVCPAKRMLTQSFRMGKRVVTNRRKAAAALRKAQEERAKAEEAAKQQAEEARKAAEEAEQAAKAAEEAARVQAADERRAARDARLTEEERAKKEAGRARYERAAKARKGGA